MYDEDNSGQIDQEEMSNVMTVKITLIKHYLQWHYFLLLVSLRDAGRHGVRIFKNEEDMFLTNIFDMINQ